MDLDAPDVTTTTATEVSALVDVTAEASLALGDSCYVDANYSEAVDFYATALLVVRESERLVYVRALSHRSAAFYQLARYEEALEDSLTALKSISLGNVAGLRPGEGQIFHQRAAMAAFQLQRYQMAKEQFASAAQLAKLNHRDDSSYLTWLQQCEDNLRPAPTVVPEQSATEHMVIRDNVANVGATTDASSTFASSPSADVKSALVPTTAAPSVSVSGVAAADIQSGSASTASAAAPRSTVSGRPTMPKYQYYQSSVVMTIAILESNVRPEDLNVQILPKRLSVILTKGGVAFTVIAGTLHDEVDVDRSRVQIRDEKVLIKLRKVTPHEWHDLMGKQTDEDKAAAKILPETVVPTVDSSKPRAYSSQRDWEKIESSLKEQEKAETPPSDEALNKLFKQIYANADEDTRRAMIKSYQTSGGTVLSTNWGEVARKDYEKERTAPKGVEWKNWEGDKLPMKDDD